MASSLLMLAILMLKFQESIQESTEDVVLKCSQDFLFSVTEESDGVGLSILYDDDASTSNAQKSSHKQQIIPDRSLSPECGKNRVRCEDPLLSTTQINRTAFQHLAFLPLADSLLIVELVQSGLQVSFGNRLLLSTQQSDSTRCNPVKAFEINHDYYLVCVDSQRSYVSMHRIFLNKTALQLSKLATAPFVIFNIRPGLDMQTLSNFVYFKEDSYAVRTVVFAVGNSMYAVDILAYSGVDYYGGVGTNCTHVKYLKYIGENRLLAYCEFVNVYYNTQVEDWEFQWWNSLDGVPYVCPNASVQLRVFANQMYLKFTIDSFVGNLDLTGNGFHDGVCFGAADRDIMFAYSDLDNGVYVVNMKSLKVTQLMSVSCEIPGCLLVDVVDDQYLVIRQADKSDANLLVFDTEKNKPLITTEHYAPALFKFVNNNTFPSGCDKGNGTIVVSFAVNTAGAIAGSVVAVTVFLIALILIGSVVVVRIHNRKKNLRRPIQENSDDESSEKVLTLSSEGYLQGDTDGFPSSARPSQIPMGMPNTYNTYAPGLPPPEQTSLPIPAQNTAGNSQQQVGNRDATTFGDPTSSTESSKEESAKALMGIATPEDMVTFNKGASWIDMPACQYQDNLELEDLPSKPADSANIVEATPKLNTVDDSREKWVEEDAQSESSHSSSYDDRHPLLEKTHA